MKQVVAAVVCAGLVLTAAGARADRVLDELDTEVVKPPSATLERAIRLYDRRDFLAATIELDKVVQRQTGDDTANTTRARLYLARSMVALGYVVMAATELRSITVDANAKERAAALATATAVLQRLDGPITQAALGTVTPVETDEAAYVQVAGGLRYFAGVGAAAANNNGGAQEFWLRIERGDRWFVAANAEISRLHLAMALGFVGVSPALPMPPSTRGDDLAALVAAGRDRDPRVARRAADELVAWAQVVALAASEGLAGDGPAALAEARAALAQVAPSDARAAFELAWLAPAAGGGSTGGGSTGGGSTAGGSTAGRSTGGGSTAGGSLPDRNHATLDAEVFLTAIGAVQCGGSASPTVDDVRAAIHAASLRATALAGNPDLAPIGQQAAIATFLAEPTPDAGDRIVASLLATSEIDRDVIEATEVSHELGMLNTADRAWQTTPIASELLQTLTVLDSVGQVRIAELEVRRLRSLGTQLDAMAGELGWLTSPAIGARASLCGYLRRPGQPIAAVAVAPAIAAAAVVTPMTPRAGGAPAHGCGCETGSADLGGLAVVGAVLVARRRRRRV